ncbi:uncharacterized protein LDX57_008885 [Aspergillus melleus]|uniref:uncharacterized protein n=1 Tax=Aspergillus melleus TaxID=138277 RepID=UPI001E8E08C9|nr:uncharacterized protein LDX57_008885 [Aspergillus melleus]KAH8431223.1 hypothetical protein LDX57_008885 [Aspergillus melleus]
MVQGSPGEIAMVVLQLSARRTAIGAHGGYCINAYHHDEENLPIFSPENGLNRREIRISSPAHYWANRSAYGLSFIHSFRSFHHSLSLLFFEFLILCRVGQTGRSPGSKYC